MCPRRSKILRLVKSANPRYPKGKAYRSTVIGSIGPHFCSAICSALLTLSGPAKPTAGNTKSNTICIARILYLSTIYLIVSSTMAGDCSLPLLPPVPLPLWPHSGSHRFKSIVVQKSFALPPIACAPLHGGTRCPELPLRAKRSGRPRS